MRRGVLIVGAEPRVAVTVSRSLARHGIPSFVAALIQGEAPVRSTAVQGFFRLPAYRDEPAACVDALVGLIRRLNVDMLVPASDTALTMTADHFAALRGVAIPACPDPSAVRAVLDKSVTAESAKRCGLRVPHSYTIPTADALERLRATLAFPLVAKPRNKSNASPFKVRYFEDFDVLREAFAEDSAFGARNVIQEYIDGTGVGIGALMRDGEPLALFQHRRLKELPATGGVSVMAVSEPLDARFSSAAVALLQRMRWTGVAMVEFKHDLANDECVLMEVNGRYWGSISLAVQAGVDFPSYEWQMRHGIRVAVRNGYRAGVRWRWLAGDLTRLDELMQDGETRRKLGTSRTRELARFVLDFRAPRGALWSITDPRPGLTEVLKTTRRTARSGMVRLVRRALSPGVVKLMDDHRMLKPPARRIFMRRHLDRLLAISPGSMRQLPGIVESILFVCHGNIIRSALAEALLREELRRRGCDSIAVRSAGIHAKAGRGADPRTIAVGKELGLNLDSHIAMPATRDIVERTDLVVAMDFVTEAQLLALAPTAARKVILLGAFCEDEAENSVEIADPYEDDISAVRTCAQTVRTAVANLANALLEERCLT
jgi:protein-tyrosine-phosphatase/predicted ATP-grasp superfamily ATP-dependent carboligase